MDFKKIEGKIDLKSLFWEYGKVGAIFIGLFLLGFCWWIGRLVLKLTMWFGNFMLRWGEKQFKKSNKEVKKND